MALQKAVKTGGGYLDLKELAADGPVVCVFHLREFHSPKVDKFLSLPVVADVLICSGARKGEVLLGETFIGAITSCLRGVRNPNTAKGEQPQPPVTAVGDEIIARVKVVNPGKDNAGAVGDVPSDAEAEVAEKVYEQSGGEGIWTTGVSATANTSPEPAMAGASASGTKRPW